MYIAYITIVASIVWGLKLRRCVALISLLSNLSKSVSEIFFEHFAP